MHERAQDTAPKIAEMLNLSEVNTVLDVGRGSGAFSMAFVKAKEGIKAIVFDLPDVTPLTKTYPQRGTG